MIKTINNLFLISLFFINFSNSIYGQIKEGKNYITPLVQPSSELHFKYAYQVDYNVLAGGQPFTFKATNVSAKRIRATFDLVALTICNNEVREKFDIALDPNESIGFGDALFGNAYIALVTKNDCADSNPVEYPYKGKKLTGKNKIKDVYIKNLVISPIPKKLAVKAGDHYVNSANNPSAKPKTELTDDEKLNQAMMKQLEKDFDNRNKPSTTVPKKTNNLDDNNSSNKPDTKFPDNKKQLERHIYVYVSFNTQSSIFLSDIIDVTSLDCNEKNGNGKIELEIYANCARIWFEKISGKTHNNKSKVGDDDYYSLWQVYFTSECWYGTGGSNCKEAATNNKADLEAQRRQDINSLHIKNNYDNVIEIHGK